MREKLKKQEIPVKVYRTEERLMVVAPMPGIEPENIAIEVTDKGQLIFYGELRGHVKGCQRTPAR